MGKFKPFILLGAALIVALITTALIYNWLQKKTRVEKPQVQTRAVVVAGADISPGTVLNKGMTKVVPFLKESAPDGCFADPAQLEGRVLISAIKAKEPIFESRLAPISVKEGGVAAIIAPKKRAIAVRVDKTIGVSGFIHPGNRVDVLVTISAGKIPDPTTKIVLENILVLAVGVEIERKGKDEKPSNVDVITIEVTPEEAEKLALAATEGRLLMALRNFSDTEEVTTKGVTIPMLLASYSSGKETRAGSKGTGSGKGVVKVKPLPAEESASAFTVELIKGTTTSEVRFERKR
jgi:pilus assembly protein CpaB